MDSTHPSAPKYVITRGGTPSPEESDAIAMALQELAERRRNLAREQAGQVSSEWMLQGRLHNLTWTPLEMRWPGEPPGRNWRRAV